MYEQHTYAPETEVLEEEPVAVEDEQYPEDELEEEGEKGFDPELFTTEEGTLELVKQRILEERGGKVEDFEVTYASYKQFTIRDGEMFDTSGKSFTKMVEASGEVGDHHQMIEFLDSAPNVYVLEDRAEPAEEGTYMYVGCAVSDGENMVSFFTLKYLIPNEELHGEEPDDLELTEDEVVSEPEPESEPEPIAAIEEIVKQPHGIELFFVKATEEPVLTEKDEEEVAEQKEVVQETKEEQPEEEAPYTAQLRALFAEDPIIIVPQAAEAPKAIEPLPEVVEETFEEPQAEAVEEEATHFIQEEIVVVAKPVPESAPREALVREEAVLDSVRMVSPEVVENPVPDEVGASPVVAEIPEHEPVQMEETSFVIEEQRSEEAVVMEALLILEQIELASVPDIAEEREPEEVSISSVNESVVETPVQEEKSESQAITLEPIISEARTEIRSQVEETPIVEEQKEVIAETTFEEPQTEVGKEEPVLSESTEFLVEENGESVQETSRERAEVEVATTLPASEESRAVTGIPVELARMLGHRTHAFTNGSPANDVGHDATEPTLSRNGVTVTMRRSLSA